MQLLIIPDIHTKVDLAHSIIDLQYNQVDQIVMLGDYVDDFDDNPAIMLRTLEAVGKWQQDEKIVMLCGNHEAAYMHPRMRCRGWDEAKQWAWDLSIQAKKFDPKGFATHWYVDDLLLTHAGLAEGRDLISQDQKLHNFIQNGIYYEELDYHKRDGGGNERGSIITSRPHYTAPTRKYKQIFGHTPTTGITKHYQNNGVNKVDLDFWYANIDTHLNTYVIVDTNNVDDMQIMYTWDIVNGYRKPLIQQSPTP